MIAAHYERANRIVVVPDALGAGAERPGSRTEIARRAQAGGNGWLGRVARAPPANGSAGVRVSARTGNDRRAVESLGVTPRGSVRGR